MRLAGYLSYIGSPISNVSRLQLFGRVPCAESGHHSPQASSPPECTIFVVYALRCCVIHGIELDALRKFWDVLNPIPPSTLQASHVSVELPPYKSLEYSNTAIQTGCCSSFTLEE